jgi:hypothetical protein
MHFYSGPPMHLLSGVDNDGVITAVGADAGQAVSAG